MKITTSFLKSNVLKISLLCLIFGTVSAQQDRFNLRFGAGVGNQFDGGNIVGTDDQTSEKAIAFRGDFLAYSLYFETSLSQSFGLKFFGNTTARLEDLKNVGALLTFYTDNSKLFGKQAFISPYLQLGMASERVSERFNIPLGGGLKFRLGSRLNLNIDYTLRSFPNQWESENSPFGESLEGYSSVQLHYNFGRKDYTFKAPNIYASSIYKNNQVEEITPEAQTVSPETETNGLSRVDELRRKKDSARAVEKELKLREEQQKKMRALDSAAQWEAAQNQKLNRKTDSLTADFAPIAIDSISKKNTDSTKMMARDSVVMVQDSLDAQPDSAIVANDTSVSVVSEKSLNTKKPNTKSWVLPNSDLSLDTSGVSAQSAQNQFFGISEEEFVGEDSTFTPFGGFATMPRENSQNVADSQPRSSGNLKPEERDSSLAYLEYQIRQQRMQNELNYLRKAKNDTSANVVISENQRLKKDLEYERKIQELQRQLLEKEGVSVLQSSENQTNTATEKSTTSTDSNPRTSRQAQPADVNITNEMPANSAAENQTKTSQEQPTVNVTTSPAEVEIIRENQSNSDDLKNALIAAGVGAGAGSAASKSDKKEIRRLEDKVEELQQQLSAMQNSINATAVVPAPALVDTVQKAAPDTAATPTTPDSTASFIADSIANLQADSIATAEKARTEQNRLAMEARLAEMQRLEKQAADADSAESAALQQQMADMKNQVNSLNKKLNEPKPDPKPKTAFELAGKTAVFFSTGSSSLSAESQRKLRDMIDYSTENPDADFIIKGFTDKTGSVAANKILSEKRAKAVKDFIIQNGVSENRLTILSLGPDASIGGGDQQFGRRVEVVLN